MQIPLNTTLKEKPEEEWGQSDFFIYGPAKTTLFFIAIIISLILFLLIGTVPYNLTATITLRKLISKGFKFLINGIKQGLVGLIKNLEKFARYIF